MAKTATVPEGTQPDTAKIVERLRGLLDDLGGASIKQMALERLVQEMIQHLPDDGPLEAIAISLKSVTASLSEKVDSAEEKALRLRSDLVDRDLKVICRGCGATASAKRDSAGYTRMSCPECGAFHCGPADAFRDAA